MRIDNQNPSFTNVTLTRKTKSLGAKAVKLYEKAAAKADNMFAAAYLVKAGQVYLQLGSS